MFTAATDNAVLLLHRRRRRRRLCGSQDGRPARLPSGRATYVPRSLATTTGDRPTDPPRHIPSASQPVDAAVEGGGLLPRVSPATERPL